MRIQYKMKEIMKNIEKAQVLTLRDQIAYGEGQVVSKTLAQNDAVSITLFAFDKGEEISSHKSGGDAFVTCLDGEGEITIDGVNYTLTEGQSIVMPAGHPHAVRGKARFKMLLSGKSTEVKRNKEACILTAGRGLLQPHAPFYLSGA